MPVKSRPGHPYYIALKAVYTYRIDLQVTVGIDDSSEYGMLPRILLI